MTEQTETPEAITVSRRLKAIPRLIVTLALLGIAWALVVHILPRMVLPVEEAAPDAAESMDTPQTASSSNAQVIALTERLEQLEVKLKTFEEVLTASQPSTATDARIAEIAERLSQLEAHTQQAGAEVTGEIKTTLSAQQADIANILAEMNKLKADNASRVAAMTAFTNLQDAALQGQSFQHQITLLSELLAARADTKELLLSLAPLANKGIATKTALNEMFEKSVNNALRPEATSGSMLGNLKSLVRVRKVGNPEGNDDESIIARAETALHNGAYEDAIAALRDLSPASASAFSAWKQSAQDYVQARKMLESLGALIMKATPEQPAEITPAAPAAEAPKIETPPAAASSPATTSTPEAANEEPMQDTTEVEDTPTELPEDEQ